MKTDIFLGDCLDILKKLPENCVDAVVTDPPAGIGFMEKEWDRMKREGMTELQAFQEFIKEVFTEVYRVLKPGGHAVVWAIPRTSHHTAMGMERAGFDIRDNGTYLFHVFGTGFPKSMNVSKAMGKAAGGVATDAAKQWQGWGTALKPAIEFWILARKPFVGTVAGNVLRYGTGALNVDGCRIPTAGEFQQPEGRWPTNLILDEGVAQDMGEPSRFFYCPKTSKRDRDEGLSLPESTPGEKTGRVDGSVGISPYAGSRSPTRNNHPTVKPTDLMRYLCRLVTPPQGVVLDPFMGSGSTGKAALLEGFNFIGIEREPEYVQIARERLTHAEASISP